MEEITTRERLLFNVGGGGELKDLCTVKLAWPSPPQLGPVEI